MCSCGGSCLTALSRCAWPGYRAHGSGFGVFRLSVHGFRSRLNSCRMLRIEVSG
jgi:hypothetical protein